VIEEVARADGSTGWCVAMGINTFRQSAQLAPDVRRELFFGDPVGISAGRRASGAAPSPPRRLPRDRALVLRQRLHALAPAARRLQGLRRRHPAPAAQRRPGGPDRVLLSQGQARIIDNWDVSGLRGTGSHDIAVEDLFVPEERTFSALDRRARVTGPMNRMHGFDLAGCGFCCVGWAWPGPPSTRSSSWPR